MGGVEKSQNLDYVIYGWPLTSYITQCEKVKKMQFHFSLAENPFIPIFIPDCNIQIFRLSNELPFGDQMLTMSFGCENPSYYTRHTMKFCNILCATDYA